MEQNHLNLLVRARNWLRILLSQNKRFLVTNPGYTKFMRELDEVIEQNRVVKPPLSEVWK